LKKVAGIESVIHRRERNINIRIQSILQIIYSIVNLLLKN